MEERAIRERWYSSDEQRQHALLRVVDLLDDEDPRVVINAARTLVAMDAQTLAWAEHELKKKIADSSGNIDLVAIARLMGAKLRGGGDGLADGGPGELPGRPDPVQ